MKFEINCRYLISVGFGYNLTEVICLEISNTAIKVKDCINGNVYWQKLDNCLIKEKLS